MLVSREPATGALLWQGEEGDVDGIVARCAAVWPGWAALPLSTRIEALRRFANLLRDREGEASDLLSRETGRPLWDSRGEVAAVVDLVAASITAYSERSGQKRAEGAMGTRQSIRHRPLGVLGVIGCASAPMQAPAAQIVPALLAGNAIAFKPSERTPACGLFLTERLHEAGIPVDIAGCIVGGPAMGKALAAHPSLAGLLFTGSAQNGIALHRAFATRPDRLLVLEMGGHTPMILWDTPDIASAVALAVHSAFLSTGQRRTSGRRLILSDRIADAAVEELRRVTARLIIDHPHAEAQPFMGPVIDMESADGLTESFLYLMSNGGRPIAHMRRPQPGLPFVTPGLIDVTAMEERPDVELFGPILQLVRVRDFDSALAEANASRFGLAAALFGGTEEQYERFRMASPAGFVAWNRSTTALPPGTPLAGIGLSGNLRPGGSYMAQQVAYPVVSLEAPQPRFSLGVGVAEAGMATTES